MYTVCIIGHKLNNRLCIVAIYNWFNFVVAEIYELRHKDRKTERETERQRETEREIERETEREKRKRGRRERETVSERRRQRERQRKKVRFHFLWGGGATYHHQGHAEFSYH